MACNKNARGEARTLDLEVHGLAHASGCDTTTPCAPHLVCMFYCWVTFSGVLAGSAAQAPPRGFEPPRARPNGFRVHLLNRSDTVSDTLAAWLQESARLRTPITNTKPCVISLYLCICKRMPLHTCAFCGVRAFVSKAGWQLRPPKRLWHEIKTRPGRLALLPLRLTAPRMRAGAIPLRHVPRTLSAILIAGLCFPVWSPAVQHKRHRGIRTPGSRAQWIPSPPP